jgi:WD40 repeat protein
VISIGLRHLFIWDFEKVELLRRAESKNNLYGTLMFCRGRLPLHPDGRRVILQNGPKSLRIWDIETGEAGRLLRGHQEQVSDLAFHPEGQLALTTSYDQTVKLWELASGRCLDSQEGHPGASHVQFSKDGKHAISTDPSGALKLWDPEVSS